MSRNFLKRLSWSHIVDIIAAAKQTLHIVQPGIDEEMAEAVINAVKQNGISVFICIDSREDVIRNGFGEEKGITGLLEHPKIQVREYAGNQISFLLADGQGCILFPESRIFSAEPSGPNAINIDAALAVRLLAKFFPTETKEQKEVLKTLLQTAEEEKDMVIQNALNDANSEQPPISQSFNQESFKIVQQSLQSNPPLEPNLQRQIKTYTAKIQFVEMKFSGINLKTRVINIPESALPIENSALKSALLANMKLFQNIDENDAFSILKDLKAREQQLRDDYLIPVSCREKKSIIKIEEKEAFKNRLQKIKDEIEKLNETLPEMVDEALYVSKRLIKTELLKFYTTNPPANIAKVINAELKQEKLQDFVGDILRDISFPKAEKIVENIFIQEHFYDLTYQDFSDEKLLDELEKRKILTKKDTQHIVDMKNAFEAKK